MDYKYKIIKFKPISKEITKYASHIENLKIGVIDLEVFNAEEPKVYAGGIYTYLSEEPLLYYIDKDTMNSYDLVLKILDELLRPKYKGITFYCHNFGRYDFNFILPVLLNYNFEHGETYKISPHFKDNRVLKLTIKKFITVACAYKTYWVCHYMW